MILLLLPLNEGRNLCYHVGRGTDSSANTSGNLTGGRRWSLAASVRDEPVGVLGGAHDRHALMFADRRLLELTRQRHALRFLLLFAVSSLDSTEVRADSLVSDQVLLGNVAELTVVRIGSKLAVIKLLIKRCLASTQ